MPNVEVYPKLGETYPDAGGVPITSVGAIVASSKYIEDSLRDGFLLTWDPLNIYNPDDRTSLGGNAPATAPYVTIGTDAILTAERVLTAGAGITITDGGANGPVTISATATGAVSSVFGRIGAVVATLGDYTSSLVSNVSAVAGATVTAALNALQGAVDTLTTGLAGKAPLSAEYLVSTASAELTAERVLTAGTGVTLTPAAGTLTVATPNAVQGPASSTLAAIPRFSTTLGNAVVNSGVTIDAGNNLAGIVAMTMTGNLTISGTVDGVDISNLAAVPFVTIGTSGAVANERALTAGTGISFTDGGAGGNLTINSTVSGGAPTTATYVCLAGDAGLANERILTAGTGVTISDNGAGSTVVISTPNAVQGPASAGDNAIARFDGTTGKLVQNSGLTIDDSSNLTVPGSITVSGTVDGVDVSNLNGTVTTLNTTVNNLAAIPYVTIGNTGSVNNERALAVGNGLVLTDGGAGSSVTLAARLNVINVAASFTVNAAHEQALVVHTGAGNITITIPTNAANALPIGYRVEILNDASSSTAIITMGTAGVTVVAVHGVFTGQIDYGDMLIWTKIGTDRWAATNGQTV